jgi:predicted nucleotidyltransferase
MNFIENPNVINIYHYGSYVYQTFNQSSDYDFLFIIKDTYSPQIKNVIINDIENPINVDVLMLDKEYTNCQIKFVKESKWKQMLFNNDIEAIEIFWLEPKYIIKNTKNFEFCINYDKIRENVSRTASNSFVKCKKKLELTKEYRIGKKSLWHSIRILMFGNQIMKYGYIKDYTEANIYYNDIVNNENNDWNHYKIKYKPIYNFLKSEFKKNHNTKTKVHQ